jgi:hypothetical protein
MTTLLARASQLAVAAAVLLAATVCATAQSGPFAGMGGSWGGGGHLSLNNGTKERIRCRATYSVADNGNRLQQSLRCASDSYNFDLRSDVHNQNGQVSGSWNEVTRAIGGMLSGRARKGQFDVNVLNPAFNVRLRLISNGSRQSVTISSTGGPVTGASISLAKRG